MKIISTLVEALENTANVDIMIAYFLMRRSNENRDFLINLEREIKAKKIIDIGCGIGLLT